MSKKKSKSIVIDTCIARSAGGPEATNKISESCRDFLTAVLNISYKAVFTRDIQAEWRKHQSNFARGWFVKMIARKKVETYNIEEDHSFLDRINSSSLIEEHKLAAIKDLILIRAALKADKIIASYDDRARGHYRALSEDMVEIRKICWVNPTIAEENVIPWLHNGARAEKSRMLGDKTS